MTVTEMETRMAMAIRASNKSMAIDMSVRSDAMRVEKLRREIGCAFAKMGFFLATFELAGDLYHYFMGRGSVVCPCGGEEWFTVRLDIWQDTDDFTPYVAPLVEHLRTHIQREVQEGKLPSAWLERIAA